MKGRFGAGEGVGEGGKLDGLCGCDESLNFPRNCRGKHGKGLMMYIHVQIQRIFNIRRDKQ